MPLTQKFLLLAAILLMALACRPTRNGMKSSSIGPDGRWSKIDSLSDLGQYATALELTDLVLADAVNGQDIMQEFKARMYRGRFQNFTGVDVAPIVRELEVRASNAPTPLAQLLHSVIAKYYWDHYQNERWQILDRTNTIADPQDMETWGQRVYMSAVIRHFQASLEPYDALSDIASEEIRSLLLPDNVRTTLRPTLFDVLAHRALEVYTNNESRLAEPAWKFSLDEPAYSDLYEQFGMRSLAHRDSTSWTFQAIRIFKQLTRLHLADDTPGALVDLDLQRLAFVRSNSSLPNKDSIYLQALETISSRVEKDSCWAEVAHAMAQWHAEKAQLYQRLAGDAFKWEKRRAQEICEQAILRFPGSFGAMNCAAFRANLQQASISFQLEEAVAPEKPFKISLATINVDHVWFRVYTYNVAVGGSMMPEQRDIGKLLGQRPLVAWDVAIADDGDLQRHVAEVAAKGLPWGHYVIVASDSERFKEGKDLVFYAHCWSTDLSITDRHAPDGQVEVAVLEREQGKPIPQQQVILHARSYERGRSLYKQVSSGTTDAHGFVRFSTPTERGPLLMEVTRGQDRFVTSGQYYGHWTGNNDDPQERHFLFLDRAIYRPGQPIWYKGIATVRRGKQTDIIPGTNIKVAFLDVHGEEIATQEVTTDEFGSFSGQFTAPQGTLTGQMRLVTPRGSQILRVEEYKRPTFEVKFDPVEGSPRLNGPVQVNGVAASYAGVPLDGSFVQWTVTRQSRMPWWCWGWWRNGIPWGTSTQIAAGATQTDGSGAFDISFEALDDPSIPRGASPIFSYSVNASVTDLNGETQSGTATVQLAHQAVQIELDIADVLFRDHADSIAIHVKNMNDLPVDLPINVTIARTIPPADPLRPRILEMPDRFLLNKTEHDAMFPNEAYTNEDDPMARPMGVPVLEVRSWRPKGALQLVGIDRWPAGDHVIEVRTTDPYGQELVVKKHFVLLDARNAAAETGDLFAMHPIGSSVEPGQNASLLITSALPDAWVCLQVEREGSLSPPEWHVLDRAQQVLTFPVTEADRGGFAVHVLHVSKGRSKLNTHFVHVPWNNKELQVEWMTFRHKMLPGSPQSWRLKISGAKGERVAAQLLAGMYDASLDRYVPHDWDMKIWDRNSSQFGWSHAEPFGLGQGWSFWRNEELPIAARRSYPALNTFGIDQYWGGVVYEMDALQLASDGAPSRGRTNNKESAGSATSAMMADADSDPPPAIAQEAAIRPAEEPPIIRSDFRETAFFYPTLLTAPDGGILFEFTIPDALTRWKFLGLAHTKDLAMASLTKEVITQRPMMITPNLPRFLREGDRIAVAAKINVVDVGRIEGRASVELFDPFTNASLNKAFGLVVSDQVFVASPGESAVVEWVLRVPYGISAVGVRTTASSTGGPPGGVKLADGEERVIPVLTDRLLVTESLPLPINSAGTKSFTFEKLLNSGSSSTLRHQSLKLEFTPNPAWYAVQALPYLMEFPHECAEQIFNRYYANRLATHITEKRPEINDVFAQWHAAGPDAFLSALEKNPDLKGIVLEETPWLINARDEKERKKRIAVLFDLQRMSAEEAASLKKLRDTQMPNGSWSWFTGMHPSRHITQLIVAGFGHLESLGASDLRPDGQVQQMIARSIGWLDAEVGKDYQQLRKRLSNEEMRSYRPGYSELHFLYARSYYLRWPIHGITNSAVEFYREQLSVEWLSYGLQEQAMIALALHRLGDKVTPALILKSLKERATVNDELGMFWKGFSSGMDWWSFPTESHALLIEAFNEITQDDDAVKQLRIHLLKLKQATDWGTTKATAEAVYALLLGGEDWLNMVAAPVIRIGSEVVDPAKGDGPFEAGTGYFSTSWDAQKIKPDMGKVLVTTAVDRVAWGAIHWQYFEQMDKVTPHESPFNIRRQVMLKRPSDQGPELVPLGSSTSVEVGDILTMRVELRSDRWVDFVHMKDLRAAGLEPVERLSGHRNQGGLGYYQSIRDAAMHFFFDRIGPGTYVFEYDLRVTHSGEFSNGITTAMCMYAPEFNTHSQGDRVVVRP